MHLAAPSVEGRRVAAKAAPACMQGREIKSFRLCCRPPARLIRPRNPEAFCMLKFYYHPSPNPAKVALFLEESGLPYEMVPVDTAKGEQHSAAYRAINPNGKTPALVDGDAVVFDSNAILLYLAVRHGKFLPENRPEVRS